MLRVSDSSQVLGSPFRYPPTPTPPQDLLVHTVLVLQEQGTQSKLLKRGHLETTISLTRVIQQNFESTGGGGGGGGEYSGPRTGSGGRKAQLALSPQSGDKGDRQGQGSLAER